MRTLTDDVIDECLYMWPYMITSSKIKVLSLAVIICKKIKLHLYWLKFVIEIGNNSLKFSGLLQEPRFHPLIKLVLLILLVESIGSDANHHVINIVILLFRFVSKTVNKGPLKNQEKKKTLVNYL